LDNRKQMPVARTIGAIGVQPKSQELSIRDRLSDYERRWIMFITGADDFLDYFNPGHQTPVGNIGCFWKVHCLESSRNAVSPSDAGEPFYREWIR